MTESQILTAVLIAVTALPDTMAWRANSGVFVTKDGQRHVRANVPGCADVLGVTRGRGLAIETKTPRGQQRPEQRAFQRQFERAGGLYVVARSADEAMAAIERSWAEWQVAA